MRKQYTAANKQADTEPCNFFPGASTQTKPKKCATATSLVYNISTQFMKNTGIIWTKEDKIYEKNCILWNTNTDYKICLQNAVNFLVTQTYIKLIARGIFVCVFPYASVGGLQVKWHLRYQLFIATVLKEMSVGGQMHTSETTNSFFRCLTDQCRNSSMVAISCDFGISKFPTKTDVLLLSYWKFILSVICYSLQVKTGSWN